MSWLRWKKLAAKVARGKESQEHALALQQEAQKRVLDRSYVPVFSTSGMVFGGGTGTNVSGPFSGGTARLAPDVLGDRSLMEIAESHDAAVFQRNSAVPLRLLSISC